MEGRSRRRHRRQEKAAAALHTQETMGRHKKDTTNLAQEAVDYLVTHDLVVHWAFDPTDPPSEEVRQLLSPYLLDHEIELTTSSLLCQYLVARLQEEHLPAGGPSRPGPGHFPSSCPTFRVVSGDED
jgi:hypothetical protein